MSLLDVTKPVRTRDGRKARIIATDQTVTEGGGYIYPIRAEVEHPNERGKFVRWNYLADGRWKSNERRNHNDLVNERPWHRWLGALG
jgi:hypothetical protein